MAEYTLHPRLHFLFEGGLSPDDHQSIRTWEPVAGEDLHRYRVTYMELVFFVIENQHDLAGLKTAFSVMKKLSPFNARYYDTNLLLALWLDNGQFDDALLEVLMAIDLPCECKKRREIRSDHLQQLFFLAGTRTNKSKKALLLLKNLPSDETENALFHLLKNKAVLTRKQFLIAWEILGEIGSKRAIPVLVAHKVTEEDHVLIDGIDKAIEWIGIRYGLGEWYIQLLSDPDNWKLQWHSSWEDLLIGFEGVFEIIRPMRLRMDGHQRLIYARTILNELFPVILNEDSCRQQIHPYIDWQLINNSSSELAEEILQLMNSLAFHLWIAPKTLKMSFCSMTMRKYTEDYFLTEFLHYRLLSYR